MGNGDYVVHVRDIDELNSLFMFLRAIHIFSEARLEQCKNK